MFYPYVMISAAQACESDDLRHEMSPFSLFSGAQRISCCVRPRRTLNWDTATEPAYLGWTRLSPWRHHVNIIIIWYSAFFSDYYQSFLFVCFVQLLCFRRSMKNLQSNKWQKSSNWCGGVKTGVETHDGKLKLKSNPTDWVLIPPEAPDSSVSSRKPAEQSKNKPQLTWFVCMQRPFKPNYQSKASCCNWNLLETDVGSVCCFFGGGSINCWAVSDSLQSLNAADKLWPRTRSVGGFMGSFGITEKLSCSAEKRKPSAVKKLLPMTSLCLLNDLGGHVGHTFSFPPWAIQIIYLIYRRRGKTACGCQILSLVLIPEWFRSDRYVHLEEI